MALLHSIAAIKLATCEQYGITPQQIVSDTRLRRIAWPRQMAMYICHRTSRHSLPVIGRHLGDRDHSTVFHGVRRAAARLQTSEHERSAFAAILDRLDNEAWSGDGVSGD